MRRCDDRQLIEISRLSALELEVSTPFPDIFFLLLVILMKSGFKYNDFNE